MTQQFWFNGNLAQACAPLHAHWHGLWQGRATNIVTDTRQIKAGDIFLALTGARFDGHDYLALARERGAAAAIVARTAPIDLPQLQVDDTRLALGLLGKFRRDACQALRVVALTGSSGKTTAKEMLASILSQVAPTLATKGNLNNDLGVPMTLLTLDDTHRYAVIELGANHLGEIAYTTQLVRPDVACVLNIGTAHLGEFGGRDNIACAKAEIFQGLKADGVAVFAQEDDYRATLHAAVQQDVKVLLAGRDIVATEVVLTEAGSRFMLGNAHDKVPVDLPLAGAHNVQNAVLVAGCALALGVDLATIAKGLSQVHPAKGRFNRLDFGVHSLIDDTYNANPNSVWASAQVLAMSPNTKWLVLGDIGELGSQADSEHYALGTRLATLDLDNVLTVGNHSAKITQALKDNGKTAIHFATKVALYDYLQAALADSVPTTVLFKGSRSAQMETLLTDLTS